MNDVRKITEGAILLAAFAVLLLITVYIPLLGTVVTLFLAVPFILFAAKNDWKSIIIFVVASILLTFIVGTVLALPLALLFGTTGSVIGYLIQMKKTTIVTFISGSLVFLVNIIIMYVASIVFFKLDMINQMIEMMRDSINMFSEMLKNYGDPEKSKKATEQLLNGLDLIKTLIPTLFVTTSFFTVLIIQLVSFPIIKRFGIKINKWKSFKEITLPKSLVWYYLFTLLASMLINPQEGTYGYAAVTNLTYILQLLMILQGFTFLFYFFDQNGISKSVSIIVVIVTIVIPFFLYIIGILGIIDLGFDLRKGFRKKE